MRCLSSSVLYADSQCYRVSNSATRLLLLEMVLITSVSKFAVSIIVLIIITVIVTILVLLVILFECSGGATLGPGGAMAPPLVGPDHELVWASWACFDGNGSPYRCGPGGPNL